MEFTTSFKDLYEALVLVENALLRSELNNIKTAREPVAIILEGSIVLNGTTYTIEAQSIHIRKPGTHSSDHEGPKKRLQQQQIVAQLQPTISIQNNTEDRDLDHLKEPPP